MCMCGICTMLLRLLVVGGGRQFAPMGVGDRRNKVIKTKVSYIEGVGTQVITNKSQTQTRPQREIVSADRGR